MSISNEWDNATPKFAADIRYPNVKVNLTGESANVRDIITRVTDAIQQGVGETEAQQFSEEATMLADAGELQMVLVFVQATVDTTGDDTVPANATCYFCDHPPVDANTDMCDYHERLSDDYLRHLNGPGW